MRFLPVLLIALALLPLSTALKCYVSSNSTEKKIVRITDDCPADFSQEYCASVEMNGVKVRSCGSKKKYQCSKVGCEPVEGGKGKLCCCKGDLCNVDPSDPTGPVHQCHVSLPADDTGNAVMDCTSPEDSSEYCGIVATANATVKGCAPKNVCNSALNMKVNGAKLYCCKGALCNKNPPAATHFCYTQMPRVNPAITELDCSMVEGMSSEYCTIMTDASKRVIKNCANERACRRGVGCVRARGMKVCCCKGALCNDKMPSAAPTHLLSFATVLTLITALF